MQGKLLKTQKGKEEAELDAERERKAKREFERQLKELKRVNDETSTLLKSGEMS